MGARVINLIKQHNLAQLRITMNRSNREGECGLSRLLEKRFTHNQKAHLTND